MTWLERMNARLDSMLDIDFDSSHSLLFQVSFPCSSPSPSPSPFHTLPSFHTFILAETQNPAKADRALNELQRATAFHSQVPYFSCCWNLPSSVDLEAGLLLLFPLLLRLPATLRLLRDNTLLFLITFLHATLL